MTKRRRRRKKKKKKKKEKKDEEEEEEKERATGNHPAENKLFQSLRTIGTNQSATRRAQCPTRPLHSTPC